MGKVSLREVARASGVSIGAVSQALNGQGRLSQATREKILQVAKDLGYRRDPLLASLAAGHFRESPKRDLLPVAFLWKPGRNTRTGDPFRDALHVTAADAAFLGYKVKAHELPDTQAGVRELGRTLFNRGYRGIIVGECYGMEQLPTFPWENFAVVFKGRRAFHQPFHTVHRHWFEAVCEAWEKCVERGYRRIGAAFFTAHPDHPDDRSRLAAALFCQDHRRSNLPVIPNFVGGYADDGGFMQWVEKHRPEVILSFPFRAAEFENWGFSIPRDFAYVHFHARDTNPYDARFTGLKDTVREEGKNALERLDWQIRHHVMGPVQEPIELLVRSSWQEGETLPWKT